MEPWLRPAIDYIGDFIAFQLEATQQPGCIIAIAHRGEIVAEFAFGLANLATGEKLTPRHRFRIASHSKALHRSRHHEVARATQAAARRSRRAICRRAASAGRRDHDRASALAQRRADPRRRRFRTVHRQPALSQQGRAARRAAAAGRDRAQHAFQIFQPRIRTGRARDRGDHRRALSGLDQA